MHPGLSTDRLPYTKTASPQATAALTLTPPRAVLFEFKQVYHNIVMTLCNPGHIGDMFQATSTNDVTFWVLHPLQVKEANPGRRRRHEADTHGGCMWHLVIGWVCVLGRHPSLVPFQRMVAARC
jgi:hypothetical protein